RKARGALEFVWSILDFQKDQDVRIKVGYEISQQDAASLAIAIMKKNLRGQTFLGCDDNPLSR
ncbi:uncharacterized protein A4U43_C07F24250, partial [Asparagus officinalis]